MLFQIVYSKKSWHNYTLRLWSISRDKAECERSKRLLDGSLQPVLDERKAADALRSVGSKQLQVTLDTSGKSEQGDLLVLLHDPCDIRKEYSTELENLGTVRSLKGTLIPGYLTFNTVVVDERGKSPQPLDISVYRNGEAHYVTQEELKQFRKPQLKHSEQEQEQKQKQKRHEEIQRVLDEDSVVNLKQVVRTHLNRVNQQMETTFPDMQRCHVLDRQFDGVPYFELPGQELQDWFVIRLKGSRTSNEEQVEDSTGKRTFIKINTVPFAQHTRYPISKIRLKHTTYQNVTCEVEWDTIQS